MRVDVDRVEIEHACGGPDQLAVLHAILDVVRAEGLLLHRGDGTRGVELRCGAGRRARLEDEAPRALRERLVAGDLPWSERPPLPTAEARAALAQLGVSGAELEKLVASEAAWGGIELGGLRFGLAPARERLGARWADDSALPVAIAPGAGLYRLGADGTLYDDTDGEPCLPVAESPIALFEYWIVALDRQRRSGAVHGWICTVYGAEAASLAAILGAGGRLAWGPRVSVWSPAAARLCAARDRLPAPADRSATLSAPSASALAEALAEALGALAASAPDLRVRLDRPELAALRQPTRVAEAIRALAPARGSRP